MGAPATHLHAVETTTPLPVDHGRAIRLTCGMSLLAAVCIAATFFWSCAQDLRLARTAAANEATRGAETIDAGLARVRAFATRAAEDLGAGKLPPGAVLDRLAEAMKIDSRIIEVGAAFAPYFGSRSVKLDGPHLATIDGKLQRFQLEKTYDYTQRDWYNTAIREGSFWSPPYRGKVVKGDLVGFSIPFKVPGRTEVAGVIRINYTLERVRDILSHLELGKGGYGYLLAHDGTFIGHPSGDVIDGERKIGDLARKHEKSGLGRIAEAASRDESAMIDFANLTTGAKSWAFLRPVKSADWSLVAVYPTAELEVIGPNLRRQLMALVAAAIVFLGTFALVLVNHAKLHPELARWLSVASVTTSLTLGIAAIWYLGLSTRYDEGSTTTPILDGPTLQKFIQNQGQSSAIAGEAELLTVPTGMFIQAIDVKSANEIAVSGYIWQKYTDGAHDGVSRGFVLPQASAEQVTEIYRQKVGPVETIGWSFRATLRQKFDFSRYPIDLQTVTIYLRRKDYTKNVLLVPDLASYESLAPTTLPGLDTHFSMGGWDPVASYYDYAFARYNTSFGLARHAERKAQPRFEFNVEIRRVFLPPFISNVLPLLFIACILFALLVMISGTSERANPLGYKSINALSICAALFFATLLAHIRLRGDFGATREMTYLEYFYFVMYFTILAVAANSYVVALDNRPAFVREGDNLLPRLFYWPAIVGLLFAVTVVFFY